MFATGYERARIGLVHDAFDIDRVAHDPPHDSTEPALHLDTYSLRVGWEVNKYTLACMLG